MSVLHPTLEPGHAPAPMAARIVQVIQTDRSSLIERIAIAGEDLVRKSFRPRPMSRLRTFLCRSRGEREFTNLRRLMAAAVPTVRPVGWDEERRLGCVVRTDLVTAYVADATDLRAMLRGLPRGRSDTALRRRALAAGYGRLIRQLHEAGFVSTSVQPRNVLVRGNGVEMCLCDQPWLIGLGRSAVGSRSGDIDLYDIAFSSARCQEFSAVERWRTVLAYCGGERDAARQLWRRLTGRGPRRQHVAKQLTRGHPGRRTGSQPG